MLLVEIIMFDLKVCNNFDNKEDSQRQIYKVLTKDSVTLKLV